jgi:hypothetical protein
VNSTPRRSSGLYLLVFGMQSGAGRQPSGLKGANMHIVSSALQGG